jgi:hypothetical protein
MTVVIRLLIEWAISPARVAAVSKREACRMAASATDIARVHNNHLHFWCVEQVIGGGFKANPKAIRVSQPEFVFNGRAGALHSLLKAGPKQRQIVGMNIGKDAFAQQVEHKPALKGDPISGYR